MKGGVFQHGGETPMKNRVLRQQSTLSHVNHAISVNYQLKTRKRPIVRKTHRFDPRRAKPTANRANYT
jgi:hypothetical protein